MRAAFKLAETVQAYRAVIDRLERRILDHRPFSAEEAAAMLEVVGENLEVGGRSDGRDLKALHRVIAFLRRPH